MVLFVVSQALDSRNLAYLTVTGFIHKLDEERNATTEIDRNLEPNQVSIHEEEQITPTRLRVDAEVDSVIQSTLSVHAQSDQVLEEKSTRTDEDSLGSSVHQSKSPGRNSKSRGVESDIVREHPSTRLNSDTPSQARNSSLQAQPDDQRITSGSALQSREQNLTAVLDEVWESRSNRTSCLEGNRPANFPLVSGDGFRCLADAILDETTNKVLTPAVGDLECGTRPLIVFVKADFLQTFFGEYYPRMPCKYVLVSHNSDYGITEGMLKYLGDVDSKLVHWYAQNTKVLHANLTAIPIGITNRYHAKITAETYMNVRQKLQKTSDKHDNPLVVLNFTPRRGTERQALLNMFQNKSWAFVQPFASKKKGTVQGEAAFSWLLDIARYKFALSPPGNGLDCHRTWELLLVGVIPVVKSNSLDAMYKDLPVLIVEDWAEVTEARLQEYWLQHGSALHEALSPALTQRYWMKRMLLH